MHSSLQDKDLLFFSPAVNSLPRHIAIDYLPVRFLKQVGVSLWFHFHAREIIERYRLERVNVHAGPGGVLCVRRLPVPLIVTCHHTYLQQISHLRSQCWKALFLPFEKRTYRLADRIVAVSQATKDALVKRYGIAEDKVSVVHNAVDIERFRPLTLPKNRHCLLYLGRIDRRKGIEFLIRSLPRVRERLPEVRLLVGGKGSHLRKMQALVARLHLQENVSFLGFVPDDQLNALYNRAQCLVVPSVFEGFGITVIEALAAGTRVVGSDADGIREILQGGESGRLVPYGDQRALAAAILAELQAPRPSAELAAEYRIERFRDGYLEALEG